jgi:Icc-related predicted phosphoesterase
VEKWNQIANRKSQITNHKRHRIAHRDLPALDHFRVGAAAPAFAHGRFEARQRFLHPLARTRFSEDAKAGATDAQCPASRVEQVQRVDDQIRAPRARFQIRAQQIHQLVPSVTIDDGDLTAPALIGVADDATCDDERGVPGSIHHSSMRAFDPDLMQHSHAFPDVTVLHPGGQGQPGTRFEYIQRAMETLMRTHLRIAAMGDLHVSKNSQGAFQPLFTQINHSADVLLLCGDFTDYGLPDEARVLARELSVVKIPVIAVLGNHDYEGGKPNEIRQILADGGVTVLDGEAIEVHGIGFAGVKGFAGGFGRGALGPWGEHAIKAFVQEAVDEALKLETALARLRTQKRVALLHYSPIRGTVEGEPPEIFAYLGSSRLEEPINRYRVSAVFHGHAHRGTPEGRTSTGVPVHNVSMPLLTRVNPNRPPFLIVEVPRDVSETTAPVEPRGEPLVKSA